MARGIRASRQRVDAAAALPKHPYRDSAVLHGVLGGLLLVIAWLTGGDISKAIVVGALYVVLATGWSWYRFRQRTLREVRVAARGGTAK